MTGNARKTAVLALCNVHNGGWANLTAKKALAGNNLSDKDKAFASALFYGTTERIVTLDFLLQPFIKKPVEKLDIEVRSVLETGLYQIMYMSVPVSAAVNEAVNLTKKLGKTSASGLVNAVLRKASQIEKTEKGPVIPYIEDEIKRIEINYSLSKQVAKEIYNNLPNGYENFLDASFAQKGISVRVNTFKTNGAELAQCFVDKGAKVVKSPMEECFYCFLPGGVANEKLFKNGYYNVQGAASQIACKSLDVKKGEKVLDLCAAPGGKSASLYMLAGGEIELLACDIQKSRLEVMEQTFSRLGLHGIKVLANDASKYNSDLCGQDKILCDVPCTGLGTIAGKPDIRYSTGENFKRLPELQLKILQTAARYIKKGGKIVYSTCTIRKEENQNVVEKFLESNENFRLLPPLLMPANAVVDNNMVTILPMNIKTPYIDNEFIINDGFFVATIERM